MLAGSTTVFTGAPFCVKVRTCPSSEACKVLPCAATCSVWSSGDFWSYDCPQALRAKRDYALRRRLGGLMFWELSHDTADLELLRALAGKP